MSRSILLICLKVKDDGWDKEVKITMKMVVEMTMKMMVEMTMKICMVVESQLEERCWKNESGSQWSSAGRRNCLLVLVMCMWRDGESKRGASIKSISWSTAFNKRWATNETRRRKRTGKQMSHTDETFHHSCGKHKWQRGRRRRNTSPGATVNSKQKRL